MVLRGSRARLRFASALVILAFVLCHLINHALALVSLDAAIAAHAILMAPWEGTAGTLLLAAAGLTHYANALWAIYRRRSLRMPAAEAWQLGLGLAIPLLMMVHLSGTRLGQEVVGIKPGYPSVLLVQWVLAPWKGAVQALLVSAVWGHAAMGLHLRFRDKPRYQSVRFWLLALVVAIFCFALSGWIAAGTLVARLATDPAWIAAVLGAAHLGPAAAAATTRLMVAGMAIHGGLLLLPFLGRQIRRWAASGQPLLTHSSGRTLRMAAGASVLETLRDNGIAHAAVCGGRARCTTCRVRILAGGKDAPPAGPEEAEALARIEAPADVRLACQLRPSADLSVLPLLPADARAIDGSLRGGMEGRERSVVVVFVDLRGSTTLGEAKLPYDMLFILHRFFQEMTRALLDTGGHYSNFTGDGLMALYGLDTGDPAEAVAAALEGACQMIARMDRLNGDLAGELPSPLRMGIGIHYGEAIVGSMGPPGSKIVSAIGDTVNTAARLESLSKTFDCPLVLSRGAAEAAGLALPAETLRQVTVAGRVEPVWVHALDAVPNLKRVASRPARRR